MDSLISSAVITISRNIKGQQYGTMCVLSSVRYLSVYWPKQCSTKYVNRRNYVKKRKNKRLYCTCRQNYSSEQPLLGSTFKINQSRQVRLSPVALTGKLKIVLRLYLSTISLFGKLFETVHHEVIKPACVSSDWQHICSCNRAPASSRFRDLLANTHLKALS